MATQTTKRSEITREINVQEFDDNIEAIRENQTRSLKNEEDFASIRSASSIYTFASEAEVTAKWTELNTAGTPPKDGTSYIRSDLKKYGVWDSSVTAKGVTTDIDIPQVNTTDTPTNASEELFPAGKILDVVDEKIEGVETKEISTTNILDGKTSELNQYLTTNDGNLANSSQTHTVSDILDVLPNEVYEIEITGTLSSNAGGIVGLNKNFVYKSEILSENVIGKTEFTIPSNVYKIRNSVNNNAGTTVVTIKKIGNALTDLDIKDLDDSKGNKIPKQEDVKELQDAVISKTDITGDLTTSNNILSSETGNTASSSNEHSITDFIEVKDSDVLLYTGIVGNFGAVAGYDENEDFLDTEVNSRAVGNILHTSDIPDYPLPFREGSTTTKVYGIELFVKDFEFTIPTGCKYIKCVSATDGLSDLGENFTIKRKNALIKSNNEATLAEINAGTSRDKYISPYSFKQYNDANTSEESGNAFSKGSVQNYNCVPDAVDKYDAVTTAGSNIVNVPSGAFTNDDIGKHISIPYAGVDGGSNNVGRSHLSTIAAVNSATQIQLADNVTQTIVGSRSITDANMTVSTRFLTSATANFSVTDVGKNIIVDGAGFMRAVTNDTDDYKLRARIIKFISSTEVELNRIAFRTVSNVNTEIDGATIIYGTDNYTQLQLAINETATNKEKLILEAGKYLITDTLKIKTDLTLDGINKYYATIFPIGNTNYSSAMEESETADILTPDKNVTLENFSVNAIGVTMDIYTSTCKCLYILNQENIKFKNLYLTNSCGTSLGCDYLVNYEISGVTVYRGGRQVEELGQSAGGSGIGIGTGYHQIENGAIFNNNVSECGNNGIFLESQSGNVQSKGVRIFGNYVRECVKGAGIGDKATYGTQIYGNIIELCRYGLYVGIGFNPILYSSNGKMNNNQIYGCGIKVTFEDGSYEITNNIINPFDLDFPYMTETLIVDVNCPDTGELDNFTFKGNTIQNVNGIPFRLSNGEFNVVDISDNKIIDSGRDTSYNLDAIDIRDNQGVLMLTDNKIIDTRITAEKQMNTGIRFDAITIDTLVDKNNVMIGLKDSDTDYSSATITTTIN